MCNKPYNTVVYYSLPTKLQTLTIKGSNINNFWNYQKYLNTNLRSEKLEKAMKSSTETN